MRPPHPPPHCPPWLLAALLLFHPALAPAAHGDPGPGRVHASTSSPAAASAAPNPPALTSTEIKALYVVNFLRFTDWPSPPPAATVAPPDAAPHFFVGIAGDRELEDELIRVTKGQKIRGREIEVRRIRSLRDLDGCDAVYFDPRITAAEAPFFSVAEGLAHLARRPVLTLSQSPDFLAQGGMINLYRDEGRLRFEIAPAHAATSGLSFSSRLLALARVMPAAPSDVAP